MLVVGVGLNEVLMQGIVEMVNMHKNFQLNVKGLHTTKFSLLS
jgi:hypothetical protein